MSTTNITLIKKRVLSISLLLPLCHLFEDHQYLKTPPETCIL